MISIVTSCSTNSFDSSEELWEHLRDPKNGYTYSKTVNGVQFTLVYKPTDLMVAQELSHKAPKSKVDSLRNKYKDYLYFSLSMSKNNTELLSNVVRNKNQFGAMVNELAFGMDQKIHMYTPKKDTISMTDYIYPRMYGMSGTTTLLLVYPREKKIKKEEYINMTIEDLGFYTGEVKFKILTSSIQNEPRLKIQ